MISRAYFPPRVPAVDTGCGGKLSGFFRRSQGQTLRRLFMDFGTCSDFADLSLDQDLTRDALFFVVPLSTPVITV